MIKICYERIENVWFATAIDDNDRIVALSFSIREPETAVRRLLDMLPPNIEFRNEKTNEYFRNLFNTLYAIYDGKETKNSFVLKMDVFSPFTQAVLLKVAQIPRGYVASYKEVAKAVYHEGAARAVGSVMANNPFPLLIPCHRVILSDGKIGNYGLGSNLKKDILEREGIAIRKGRVERKYLWKF